MSAEHLIAEARRRRDEWSDLADVPSDVALIARLADALADATASLDGRFAESDHLSAKYYQRMRAAEREMHARELHHFEEEQKSAGLAAIVEKVRGVIGAEIGWESPAILIDRIQWALSTAPADALREHDAALIESLAEAWAADPDAWGDNDKDYRNELRDRAQQIREGGN